MRFLGILICIVLGNPALYGQDPAPAAGPEALSVLRLAAEKYAESKSLYLEATQEISHGNEFSREWSKTILSVWVAPNGRYRYSARGPQGLAELISDGDKIWIYHHKDNLFTETSTQPSNSPKSRFIDSEDEGLRIAKGLASALPRIADRLNSAAFLGEESLAVNGALTLCVRVHYSTADLKKRDLSEPNNVELDKSEEGTYWIDKKRMVIVKMERHVNTIAKRPDSAERTQSKEDISTTFSVVDLNYPISSAAFVFQAPPGAKLVDEFPARKHFDQQQAALALAENKANSDLLGKPAPDVTLRNLEGGSLTLKSFQGKPVLVDVWATWCGACVAMIPELKKLHHELSAHGVVFLTVDVADDPQAAGKLLRDAQVPWQNLHDADGRMQAAFHASQAVPWQILLDDEGNLQLYHFGEDIGTLREAISALGPQYRWLIGTPVQRSR